MVRQYLNYLDYYHHPEGNERRLEMLDDILSNGTFLPKTVTYKDIDQTFKEWAESLTIVSDEGTEFPTMTLYSNQRFSEYSQTWSYTDTNNNIILDFKTVNRENNPQYGKIQGGFWNIPGERYYLMKRQLVQDDNGSESLLDLKMKQPMAIDLVYKLTIFTKKYEKLNEFNMLLNDKFKARQCYIRPNEHYMPMTLDGISDESSYNIDDRQYYSQAFNIKVNAYIITENDFRTEEIPLKRDIVDVLTLKKKKAKVEIEECEEVVESDYYYKPLILTIDFPSCQREATFTIDTDFISTEIHTENILPNYIFIINGEKQDGNKTLNLNNNDKVTIRIGRKRVNDKSFMRITGYDPDTVYDEKLDNVENDLDLKQFDEEYIIKDDD